MPRNRQIHCCGSRPATNHRGRARNVGRLCATPPMAIGPIARRGGRRLSSTAQAAPAWPPAGPAQAPAPPPPSDTLAQTLPLLLSGNGGGVLTRRFRVSGRVATVLAPAPKTCIGRPLLPSLPPPLSPPRPPRARTAASPSRPLPPLPARHPPRHASPARRHCRRARRL